MNYQNFLRKGEFGSFIEPSNTWRTAATEERLRLRQGRISKTIADQTNEFLEAGGRIEEVPGFEAVTDKKESARLPNPNAFVRRKKKHLKLSAQAVCQNSEVDAYIAKGYLKTKDFCAMAECTEKSFRNHKRHLKTATRLGHLLVTHKSDIETLWRLLRNKKNLSR